MKLLVKNIYQVSNNPDKAKRCFDPQKDYDAFMLYTPSAKVQELSPVHAQASPSGLPASSDRAGGR